jgi:diacylglycerol kinase family enzyme
VRITLIHNPGAGDQQGGDRQGLVRLLKAEGHDVRPQSADDDDWKQALDSPADLVAVAGGDGTVARVAKAMAGRGIPMTALPAGTANNISRSLGLVERPWEELIRAWPEARRLKLDIGMAKGPWGERYVVEGVGAGLFAHLLGSKDSRRQPPHYASAEERVSHALDLLKQRALDCPAMALEATLDGKDVSGRYILFEALNINYVGPNLFLAPESQPGDGRLDVVLVREAERDRLTNYLAAWQENRERLSVLPSHQGKHLQLQWNGFEVHIDDELWPGKSDKPKAKRAVIDLTVGDITVEFQAPDAKQAGKG